MGSQSNIPSSAKHPRAENKQITVTGLSSGKVTDKPKLQETWTVGAQAAQFCYARGYVLCLLAWPTSTCTELQPGRRAPALPAPVLQTREAPSLHGGWRTRSGRLRVVSSDEAQP